MQVLERAKGRDAPSGGILDVVTRQPYLLSRAGESAQEGHKTGVGRVCCRVPRDSVVGDAESSLVVRLVQAHVDPGAVLQVPFLVGFAGAFLQQGIGDLVVDVLFGTREEPGTLTQSGAPSSLVPLVWESNPKLQGGWCKPNHQPIGGSDPNHQGIWSPPRAGLWRSAQLAEA